MQDLLVLHKWANRLTVLIDFRTVNKKLNILLPLVSRPESFVECLSVALATSLDVWPEPPPAVNHVPHP